MKLLLVYQHNNRDGMLYDRVSPLGEVAGFSDRERGPWGERKVDAGERGRQPIEPYPKFKLVNLPIDFVE